MKKVIALSATLALLSSSIAAAATDCRVGFKIKNGVFSQKLRNRTERNLGLQDFKGDQFNIDQLHFNVEPKYDSKGNYKKCEIKHLNYAGESFSGLGTALKKAAVGTGLFVAGIGTIALTIAAILAENQESKEMIDSNDKHYGHHTVIVTYDHIDPLYYPYFSSRYDYRVHYPYYEYNYHYAHQYYELQAAELGLFAGTMLIIEAFKAPKRMRSTNFQTPAENFIAETNCNVEKIKSELIFDQYLYCGNFKSNPQNSFYQKNSKVEALLKKALMEIKKGSYSKVQKLLSGEALAQLTNEKFNDLRSQLITAPSSSIEVNDAVSGRTPFDRQQKLNAQMAEIPVQVSCQQEWNYDKTELLRLQNDFIPLNQFGKCTISSF